MTTSIKLTDTQRKILEHAADHPNNQFIWFPDNVRGGARHKVVEGLFNRALIIRNDQGDWFVTPDGYKALGRARPVPASIHADPQVETAVTAAEANWAQEKQDAAQSLIKVGVEGKPRTRENSKQATVIEMLRRPNGATINEICEATEWQSHTVRGFFAGAVTKKLGLNITSYKDTGASRVYRLTEQEAATC
jgi:hypothetical protein